MIQETHDLESNILYELLIYSEWHQEPEVLAKVANSRTEERGYGYLSKWLKPLIQQRSSYLIHQLNDLQLPWIFAIGGNGAVIAILQDACLEIRTSRDEYGAIIGKTQVPRDSHPQWRRILWSPDCTMLVCAYSNGKLDFYDLIGAHMFSIDNMSTAVQNGRQDFSCAIAGMAFSDVRTKNTQWSYEFIVANYRGNIYGFFVSPSDGFKTSHRTFSLESYFSTGITSFAYHPTDHLLIICGKSQSTSDTSESAQMGMSVWRVLSDYPNYKPAFSSFETMSHTKSNWTSLLTPCTFYQNTNQDLVFKMCLSPNGKILACVHLSGALSLWDMPSLRLKKFWPLNLQPNYADVNPRYSEPGMKKKTEYILSDALYSHIIDINWWSDEAIIIARRCGAVTVSSINSLQNLLGTSPEWFEPSPAVTSFCDRGFLSIESEMRFSKKRKSIGDSDDEDESEDEDDVSVFTYSYEMAQKVLYFITDSDRFQPPRKKTKMVSKIYRLLCLKSTTPEELYTRKINNEEYGEALVLANTYNLDSDLVYQRQWRKMSATVETIHDYLSKIKKRSWVLHECMERVPENFDAAKELLLYGLQGTDLTTLIAIGKGEDHGKFIVSKTIDNDIEDYEPSLSFGSKAQDEYEIKKLQQQKKNNELLKQVNFKKLTLEQKQLCQCRLKLLSYLDRLTAYEIILGGAMAAEQHYDHIFFKKFRTQNVLEATLSFACNSDWEAVATLFTYYGREVLDHRLVVLNNFPETTAPVEYQSLLPLYNERECKFYSWDEHGLREPDWCEIKYTKQPTSEDFVQEFYGKCRYLEKYRQSQLSLSLATEWFVERAKEIESRSGLVENALQLLKLGMQRSIKGLEELYDEMTTLDTIVYECGVKINLSLKEYEKLSDFEKVKLMLSETSKENFLKGLKQWVIPFLTRCKRYCPDSGKSHFKSYILHMSKDDLYYCKKVLEDIKSDISLVISDFDEIINLILDCIYNCERSDELKNARSIYELLLSLPDAFNRIPRKLNSLPATVSNLKRHIRVAELLDQNGLALPLSIVRNMSDNADEVKKVLTKLTRMASHRIPVLDEAEWSALLSDILEMHKIQFDCISYEDCYEIVLNSLLCSGRLENIPFAGKMMHCSSKPKKQRIGPQSFKLSYSKSVALVLNASQEYFNSSSNASDPCMHLAKNCLNLIEDVPASIEEEFDLISSVSLLQEFDVNILPLQVRLCENRITLVQEALKRKEKSFKQSQKIMKLAHLLRAGGSDTHIREGKVLVLIGDHAFRAKDYKECWSVCQKLIEGRHEDGWMLCFTLGSCAEFSNITARLSLMSFALAYCSEDLIETILKNKSELQLQVLQDRVRFLVGDIPAHWASENVETKDSVLEEEDMESLNSIWHTGEKTIHTLQSTTQTATKLVTSSIKSGLFWKDAMSWIQPSLMRWNSDTSEAEEDSNKDLSRPGIIAFNGGSIPNGYISKLEANYLRYARPDLPQPLEISSSILRAALLQDGLKFETDNSVLENSVLLDVAKAYLPEDFVYSLFTLLTLKEVDKAEVLFKTLPSSPIVLQFANLYYAFRICISLKLPILDTLNSLPDTLAFCKKILGMRTSESQKENTDLDKYWDLLQKYDKMLHDFVQAEVLHNIGGGVDATRFANDDQYKKDTILGIAMTLDDNVFQTAVSLAQHYNVPTWDLYLTHLEFLFSEPSATATVITERLERLQILPKMLQHKKKFEKKLREHVYPSISGKDHEKLLICLSLLEECGDKEDDLRVKPSIHKKILNKLRATMKSVDFKLMSPELSGTYISEILNESNVHVFAKVAGDLPKKGSTFYEPSNVYCLWTQKYFFEGKSSDSKDLSTKTEWVHRYESCADMLLKLSPTDILELVDCIIFSDKAIEKMTVDCRSEILKRLIKFCRGKASKSKMETSIVWSDAATQLNSLYLHLQRLEDEIILSLKDSTDPKIKEYCKDFDQSKSSIEKLQCLLVRIVLEGPDLELLKTFISCCPPEVEWEPADAYIKAIDEIFSQMKQSSDAAFMCFKTTTPIQVLEAILSDVMNPQEELLIIEDMVAEKVDEFCKDPQASVSARLSILQLLEKTNLIRLISPDKQDLLLLYRTQAVVLSQWPEIQVSEEEIKDEFQRRTLFDSLLSLCKTIDHFKTLERLLSHWPPFAINGDESFEDEVWTKLLCGLISFSTKEALDTAVDFLDKALLNPDTFNKECRQIVFEKIKGQGYILFILKSTLKMNLNQETLSEVLELLKKTSVVTSEDYDSELLDLILKHRLTAQIVETGLYKPVIEFLLHCQDDNLQDSYKTIDFVVKELHDAGYHSEAGSLLLIKNATHTGLSTFSAAMGALNRWLMGTKL